MKVTQEKHAWIQLVENVLRPFWSLWSQENWNSLGSITKSGKIFSRIWFAGVCDSNVRKSWCFLLTSEAEWLHSLGFGVGKRRRKPRGSIFVSSRSDRGRRAAAASGDSCWCWGHAAKPFKMKLPVLFNFARQFFILWMVTRGKKICCFRQQCINPLCP